MSGTVERMRRLAVLVGRTFPGRVGRKAWIEDNVPSQAALIAWNLLGSLFPIALALATILGVVFGTGAHSEGVYRLVAAAIPDPQGQQQVLASLRGVRTQTGLFSILALAGFLWTASALFGAMEQAFDLIFHVPMRDFLQQKVVAVLMMVIFTALAGLAILTSALLPLVARLPGLSASVLTHGLAALLTQFVIGSVSSFLLYFVTYYVVPNRKQEVRQVWPGALFAGVAFELLSLCFPLYLHFAGSGMNQYGRTFALLFILMFFLFCVGMITMLGIEINAVLYPVPIPQPNRVDALGPAATGEGRPPTEAAERRGKARAAQRPDP
jgi:membrane protein